MVMEALRGADLEKVLQYQWLKKDVERAQDAYNRNLLVLRDTGIIDILREKEAKHKNIAKGAGYIELSSYPTIGRNAAMPTVLGIVGEPDCKITFAWQIPEDSGKQYFMSAKASGNTLSFQTWDSFDIPLIDLVPSPEGRKVQLAQAAKVFDVSYIHSHLDRKVPTS